MTSCIDGLVQDCNNSIANALELLQSCTKPSVCYALMKKLCVNKRIKASFWVYTSACSVFLCIILHKRQLISALFIKLGHNNLTRQIWGIWKLRPAYSPETPNFGQDRWCFVPCDLEIWWITLENKRASLLCCFKLCATFHSHWWIQTGVTVRKRPIWVKFDDF